jgi:predicted RNA-binding Zn ribbon-like protein
MLNGYAMDVADIPLIAGHPALDFLNSVEEPGATGDADYLADYESLARWSLRTGLIASATPLLRAAVRHPDKARRAWAEAVDLRTALDAVFRTIARGKPPPAEALERCNTVLARAHAHRRIIAQRGGLAWAWDDPEDLRVPGWQIALSAAALLTDPARLAKVRICDGDECPWMFLDESRTGRRRWCRMNVCGNAAKVKSFRDRQRDHSHG